MNFSMPSNLCAILLQDLYCVRSDLGNLLKALGRLDEAKVGLLTHMAYSHSWRLFQNAPN
jgi:hypothetical protein